MDTRAWGTEEWLKELKAHLEHSLKTLYPEEDEIAQRVNRHVSLLQHFIVPMQITLDYEESGQPENGDLDSCVQYAQVELRNPTIASKRWRNFKPFAEWLGCTLPVDEQAAAEDTKSFDKTMADSSPPRSSPPRSERSVSPQSGIFAKSSAYGGSDFDRAPSDQLKADNPEEQGLKRRRAGSHSSQSGGSHSSRSDNDGSDTSVQKQESKRRRADSNNDGSNASVQETSPPSPTGSQMSTSDDSLRQQWLMVGQEGTIPVTEGDTASK